VNAVTLSRRFSYTNQFRDGFKKLHPIDQERVRRVIDDIKKEPDKGKILQRKPLSFSYRIGDLRVVYEFDDESLTFTACGPRKKVYKRLQETSSRKEDLP